MRDVVLYGLDTMADWEYPYVLAGVAMAAEQGPPRHRTRIVTDRGEPVTSTPGLTRSAPRWASPSSSTRSRSSG